MNLLRTLTTIDEPCIILTLAAVPESAPRSPGAQMIVTAGAVHDTIGGGTVEREAVNHARAILSEADPDGTSVWWRPESSEEFEVLLDPVIHGGSLWLAAAARAEDTWVAVVPRAEPEKRLLVSAEKVLGTLPDGADQPWSIARARALLADPAAESRFDVASDAGGAAPSFFIVLRLPEMRVAVFGAGHVGRALVNVLRELPCEVLWIDDRPEMLPAADEGSIRVRACPSPAAEARALPARMLAVVLTHSHELDREVCGALLRRHDLPFVGLLGSHRKRNAFEERWREEGLAAERMERLVCPVGISSIRGRSPGAIAVAIAAQLLEVHESLAGHAAGQGQTQRS
jgi:xanthine dehydrogenase accessory factor